jgi:hypothetical protein
MNEPSVPSISGRVGQVIGGHWDTRQAPTETQRRNIEIASGAFNDLVQELTEVVEGPVARLEEDLAASGAPWIPGQKVSGG